jgi:hypothetical protein
VYATGGLLIYFRAGIMLAIKICMKFYLSFFTATICFLFSCNDRSSNDQTIETVQSQKDISTPQDSINEKKSRIISAGRLIVPGISIGNILINENMDSVFQQLGKPDAGDAAMGKSLSTWYLQPKTNDSIMQPQINIYAGRNMGIGREISRVIQIRVTSSQFATSKDIHTGASLTAVTNEFKNLKKVSVYKTGKNLIDVFSDAANGIAFEFDTTQKCIAIIVYEPTKNVHETYIPVHP